MSPELAWGGLAALVLILETIGIVGQRQDDTISELTRKYFKTETPLGALVFGVGWMGFALWFLWHILWQHPRKRA